METRISIIENWIGGRTPYSLGKLVEWKLLPVKCLGLRYSTPYSLGKLVEWKPGWICIRLESTPCSLLAREIS